MTMRDTLDRSLEAVAADALRGCTSEADLDEAWDYHRTMFDEDSAERMRTYRLYLDLKVEIHNAERAARMLRV